MKTCPNTGHTNPHWSTLPVRCHRCGSKHTVSTVLEQMSPSELERMPPPDSWSVFLHVSGADLSTLAVLLVLLMLKCQNGPAVYAYLSPLSPIIHYSYFLFYAYFQMQMRVSRLCTI